MTGEIDRIQERIVFLRTLLSPPAPLWINSGEVRRRIRVEQDRLSDEYEKMAPGCTVLTKQEIAE